MTGNFIVMVLLILGVAAYYILKWAFKLLCLITAVIVRAVGGCCQKAQEKESQKGHYRRTVCRYRIKYQRDFNSSGGSEQGEIRLI